MDWISLEKLKVLEALVDNIATGDNAALGEISPRERVALAKAEWARRRRRQTVFAAAEFFSDPAWDILLELFIADHEGEKMAVSSIGIDAGIPQATAIRWLSLLERHNLVQRKPDINDKRRQWVSITANCRKMMHSYFTFNQC